MMVGFGTEKDLLKTTDYWLVRNSWCVLFVVCAFTCACCCDVRLRLSLSAR